MNINYLGHSSFKIEGKTTIGSSLTLITDPYDNSSLSTPFKNQPADIVTLSHNHEDHNNLKGIKGERDKDYFLIDSPGEYEVKGLRIYGYKSFHDEKEGKERGLNSIYVYDFNEARVAHLGDLGHELDKELINELSGVDILFIPVGGIYTIGIDTALEMIEKIDPFIVIPMHYKTAKHLSDFDKCSTLDEFCHEAGITEIKRNKEFKLKSHDDLPEEMLIYPMEQS